MNTSIYLWGISNNDWMRIFDGQSAVPIIVGTVAIVAGVTFATVKAVLRHKERIAKIENGIDPDRPT